ncbi:hypothetical protein, partial [Stenotrophomonas maltophilia]|uniref:hypothetical protein n=1 Tax=Stenotrophomonas maltophilia TaxID=40324 RepID=UPI00195420BB
MRIRPPKRCFFLIMDCDFDLSAGVGLPPQQQQTSTSLACGKSYSPQPINGTSRRPNGSIIDISLEVPASRNIARTPMFPRPLLL